MTNFIFGIILGIAVATVGFSGMAHILDRGVDSVKEVVRDTAK